MEYLHYKMTGSRFSSMLIHNKLTLTPDKTNFTKFCTNNRNCVDLNIRYNKRYLRTRNNLLVYQLEEVYCIRTVGCKNSTSVHADVMSAIMETITRSLIRGI